MGKKPIIAVVAVVLAVGLPVGWLTATRSGRATRLSFTCRYFDDPGSCCALWSLPRGSDYDELLHHGCVDLGSTCCCDNIVLADPREEDVVRDELDAARCALGVATSCTAVETRAMVRGAPLTAVAFRLGLLVGAYPGSDDELDATRIATLAARLGFDPPFEPEYVQGLEAPGLEFLDGDVAPGAQSWMLSFHGARTAASFQLGVLLSAGARHVADAADRDAVLARLEARARALAVVAVSPDEEWGAVVAVLREPGLSSEAMGARVAPILEAMAVRIAGTAVVTGPDAEPTVASAEPTPAVPTDAATEAGFPVRTFDDGAYSIRFPEPVVLEGGDGVRSAAAVLGDQVYGFLISELEGSDTIPLDVVRGITGVTTEDREVTEEIEVDLDGRRAIRRRFVVRGMTSRLRSRVEYAFAIGTVIFVVFVGQETGFADADAEALARSVTARPVTVALAGSCLRPLSNTCTESTTALATPGTHTFFTTEESCEGVSGTWSAEPCPDEFDHPLLRTWHPVRGRACVYDGGRVLEHEYLVEGTTTDTMLAEFAAHCGGELVPATPRARLAGLP